MDIGLVFLLAVFVVAAGFVALCILFWRQEAKRTEAPDDYLALLTRFNPDEGHLFWIKDVGSIVPSEVLIEWSPLKKNGSAVIAPDHSARVVLGDEIISCLARGGIFCRAEFVCLSNEETVRFVRQAMFPRHLWRAEYRGEFYYARLLWFERKTELIHSAQLVGESITIGNFGTKKIGWTAKSLPPDIARTFLCYCATRKL